MALVPEREAVDLGLFRIERWPLALWLEHVLPTGQTWGCGLRELRSPCSPERVSFGLNTG